MITLKRIHEIRRELEKYCIGENPIGEDVTSIAKPKEYLEIVERLAAIITAITL